MRKHRKYMEQHPEAKNYRVVAALRDGPCTDYVMGELEAKSLVHRLNSLCAQGKIQAFKGYPMFVVMEMTPDGEVPVD